MSQDNSKMPPQGDEITKKIVAQMVGVIVTAWEEERAPAHWEKALNVLARLDAAGFLRKPDEIMAHAQAEAAKLLNAQREAATATKN